MKLSNFIFTITTTNPLTSLLFVSPVWLYSDFSHLQQRANLPRGSLDVHPAADICLTAWVLILSLRNWKDYYRMLGSFNREGVSEQIVLQNWPHSVSLLKNWLQEGLCFVFLSPFFSLVLCSLKQSVPILGIMGLIFYSKSRYIALLAQCHLAVLLICVG